MVNLEDLGFAKGIIFETIVSTYSSQGSPNIAAMGVLQLDSENIMIRIYKSSKTYNNLVSRRCAIINLSSPSEETAWKSPPFSRRQVPGKAVDRTDSTTAITNITNCILHFNIN